MVLFAFASVVLTFAFFVLNGLGVFGAPARYDTYQPSPRAAFLVQRLTQSRLSAFTDQTLDAYVDTLGVAQSIEHRRQQLAYSTSSLDFAEEAEAAPGQAAAPESITNTQEAGVDEGGIVKAHGEHLVVLRRGRLFSVHLGDGGALRPVSRIDAYPPGVQGGWYDEMLIAGDTIVVIGFNYQSSGTEIGRFHIDDTGQLTRVDTHYLTSDDYYSSRNYASRLIGDDLIFYMPYGLIRPQYDGDDVSLSVHYPGTRAADQEGWDDILEAHDILRPVQTTADPVVHTVVRCDLREPTLRCQARGMLGPPSRSFYVSPSAVYVWVSPDRWGHTLGEHDAVVYRLPLDGTPIGAVRASGTPIDQFAFREANGQLTVLVRAVGGGDQMWAAEEDGVSLAVMRVPLSAFTDGLSEAGRDAFTAVPNAEGGSLHVRHVGDHVLYGAGSGWWGEAPGERPLFVHGTDGRTTRIDLPHGVDRLDLLGPRGVAIGAGSDGLHFSAIDLGGVPRQVGSYVQPGAREGESRSHGFFYKPRDGEGGVLGLPVRYRGGRWSEYTHGSAGVMFLDVDNRDEVTFSGRGSLDASGETTEDHCVASCTDWYGNARPIFYRGRVFALLGYELVEGRVDGERIVEVSRTNLYEDQGRTAEALDAGVVEDAGVPTSPNPSE